MHRCSFFIVKWCKPVTKEIKVCLVCSFMYAQGSRVSLLLADKFIDSELKVLPANIPFRVIQARAPTTAGKYSRAL